MLLPVSLRRAASVALLAASLTVLSAACGRQQPAAGASPSDSAGGGTPSASALPSGTGTGRGLGARRVYFSTGVGGGRDIRTVLDDERDLERFPGWFARSDPKTAREIAEKTQGTDFSRHVLVGWSRSTGCGVATGAALLTTGTGSAGGERLVLGIDQSRPQAECFAPNRVTVVFAVPRDRMPDEPRFGPEGAKADPPGPGTTVAFVRQEPAASSSPLPQADQGQGTEVTTEAQLARFLSRLPDNGAATIRKQLAAHPVQREERRFGYVLSGCAPTGAAMVISPGRAPAAVTTGDENIRCVRAQHYVAVLAVPANLVPGID
jgi:hypothetical protein